MERTMHDHIHVISNVYTPREAVEQSGHLGRQRANMRLDKVFVSAVVAGMLLAFACAVSLSTQTAPWYQDNAPGLIRMVGAVIFPFGLCMIVLTGVDLCTGSFMITTVAVLQRRLSVTKMLLHWFVCFWGNLAGSLFVVALITGYGDVFSTPPYSTQAIAFANRKAVTPPWHAIFLRGIGANWLVCLAIFLSFMARDYAGKILAVWWPTFAFVALGFDHVVANMFFIPNAIWQKDPQITVGYYIWKSLIPALIGNIIGGGLFVGVLYWYLHQADEPPVSIDGNFYTAGKEPILTLGTRLWKSGGSSPDPASSGNNSPHENNTSEVKRSVEEMA